MIEQRYYSDYGNDALTPKYPVTYFMLDTYIKKTIDDEIKRLTEVIEKKAEALSTNMGKELKMLKDELKQMKEKINKKPKEDKTIADTFTPAEVEAPNE